MEKANVIQKAFYRSAAYLKRHSPTILTFVGATGVVATIIMSARATPKAMKLLEEAEVQKGEELDKLETIRTAAPAYIPVAAIGISSLICLFGANVLNQRNQASLTAAYVMLNESYSRYRGAANTVFGDDADSKIKAEVAMGITVGIGRAWFNHTWTLNDSLLPLTLANSDVLLNRIDAIVLEVNNNTEVRKNTIKILKGTPASKPVKPSLIESELVNQHPLAYISVPKGATSISQSNITNAVGTSECPFVTGVLEGMDIDKLVAQWGAQWAEWLSSNTDAWKAFMSDNTNEWKSFMAKNKNEWSALINGNTSEFETWFEHMKDQLSEDAAGNLQLQVDNLNNAALGGDFVLKGSPVSVEYMGANRIASITAYGENAQGGTTEAPVALTGVDSVLLGGNNLLPKATETKTLNGVTFTPNPNGSVSVSGTATNNAAYVFANGLDDSLFGQTVCLSGGSMQTQLVINEKKPSGEWLRNVIINAKTPTAVGVLSKQVDDNILYGTIYVPTGTTVNTTIYPMLNLGSTAMPYEPYQGSVTPLPIPRPLHKVGDVRDVCQTRVKSVYDKHIVLSSADGFSFSSNAGNGYARFYKAYNSAKLSPIASDWLPGYAKTAYDATNEGVYSADSDAGTISIVLSIQRLIAAGATSGDTSTYLSAASAIFSAHPLTVYYQSTAYDGTNGLDVCLTEYQNDFVELDGTENWVQGTGSNAGYLEAQVLKNTNESHLAVSSIAPFKYQFSGNCVFVTNNKVTFGSALGSAYTVDTWKAYLAAQKAAGTPVQIAYQLATPEVYATDPVDFDNAAGPLTVLTGGELEAAFKSADKVVESRIDFVEDTLNEQGQAIAEKAPISHSSDKSTYGLGSGSQFGHVKLSDATASGSNAGQGIAATPSAVNQVNARVSTVDGIARAAMPKSGGTFTGNVLASSANEAGAFLRNISVQNSASQLQYTNFIIMVRK